MIFLRGAIRLAPSPGVPWSNQAGSAQPPFWCGVRWLLTLDVSERARCETLAVNTRVQFFAWRSTGRLSW